MARVEIEPTSKPWPGLPRHKASLTSGCELGLRHNTGCRGATCGSYNRGSLSNQTDLCLPSEHPDSSRDSRDMGRSEDRDRNVGTGVDVTIFDLSKREGNSGSNKRDANANSRRSVT